MSTHLFPSEHRVKDRRWPSRTYRVLLFVDGTSECGCGAEEGCEHVARARRLAFDPCRQAIEDIVEGWMSEEVWRGDQAARAAYAVRMMQRAQEAIAADDSRLDALAADDERAADTRPAPERVEELFARYGGP